MFNAVRFAGFQTESTLESTQYRRSKVLLLVTNKPLAKPIPLSHRCVITECSFLNTNIIHSLLAESGSPQPSLGGKESNLATPFEVLEEKHIYYIHWG